MAEKDAVVEALGGHEKKPAKEIDHIRIRKAKSGGHIIEHHHTHPDHHPKEEHVTRGDDQLAEHTLSAMGTPNPGEAEADAGTPEAAPSAAAPAGSGAPMPGAGAAAMGA